MAENNEILNFEIEENTENVLSGIIKIIGVGGGGSNAVNNMYEAGIKDVDFIVCNTDVQALEKSPVNNKIQLGKELTEGLGAGNDPQQGADAARETEDKIEQALKGAKMIFITAGMGGGTGTGAAPVIAQIAKKLEILTVAIVTIPFAFEGNQRIKQAIEGLKNLQKYVDAMVVIDNNKLIELYGELDIDEAFKKADDVLLTAAKGIAEIITKHGHINVDFADVKTVLSNSGVAIMGAGSASGEGRAKKAVENALSSPLLSFANIVGAEKILLNVASKQPLITKELQEIANLVQEKTRKSGQADMIWGDTKDPEMEHELKVTIIATGFQADIIPSLSDYSNSSKKINNVSQDINDFEVELRNYLTGKKRQNYNNYHDPDTIEKLYEEPAYKRQNIDI